MISVIVYGRNDAHGYNLHRRAALSLNCLAEVLTDSNDEIVFVDYNTPAELPTFVEALADTLSARCLELLRVIRVPAELHEERFGGRTHLVVVEPVARNVAARRAKPSNRWLLSTNTDMVFLPLGDESLSEVCDRIDAGFYGLPRFELPEWLWEQLPRSDPRRAMDEIRRFGPGLRLDEQTLSHAFIRYDAPGDFQLCLREDFVAIGGFDEEMLLGWHVDSNLSRRMSIRRGSIESLEERLAGYHCNHNRTPTIYHSAQGVSNDLDRFFYSVEEAELPGQRETWGLADVALEEVHVRQRLSAGIAADVMAAIPEDPAPRTASDALEAGFALSYDSGHVLPFIADSLVVSPPGADVGYIGANPVLRDMLESLLARLDSSLGVVDLEQSGSVDAVVRAAHVIIVDLGIDQSLAEEAASVRRGFVRLPPGLDRVFVALEKLVQAERARVEQGGHPRRIVLVNSSAALWDGYVLAHFVCSYTTVHSRVRRAHVKPVPPSDEVTQAALRRQRRLIRWAMRPQHDRLLLRSGEEIDFANLDDYGGFREGWSHPDEDGIWTQGPRAELAVALDGLEAGLDSVVVLSLGDVCIGPGDALPVELHLDGELIARRTFSQRDPGLTWVVELPQGGRGDAEADLSLVIEEPRTPRELGWSQDDRPLGIFIRRLTFAPVSDAAVQEALQWQRRLVRWASRDVEAGRLVVRPGEELGFANLSEYRGFGTGWSYPDETGTWTEGPRSELALALEDLDDTEYALVLSIPAVCVGPDDVLAVELLANGEQIARRELSERDPGVVWVVNLPERAVAERQVDLTFLITEPRTPLALGWSFDDRPLGILVSDLTLLPRSDEAAREALLRQGRLMRWASRPHSRLELRSGQEVELAAQGDYRGFREGWGHPDEAGVWTQGPHAELALALAGHRPGLDHVLVLSLGDVCIGPDDTLPVELRLDGEPIARRTFSQRGPGLAWLVELPRESLAGEADLSFEIDEPRTPHELGWSPDERPLGIFLRGLSLLALDRSLDAGERVEFMPGSGAERFLGDGWSVLQDTGVWTVDDRASLAVGLTDANPGDVELILEVSAFVTPDHPELDVEVASRNERLTGRVFRVGEPDAFVRVPFPAAAADESGHTVLELRMNEPAAPADFGMSEDTRRLGLHLRALSLQRTGVRTSFRYALVNAALRLVRPRPLRRLVGRVRSLLGAATPRG